jgi:hypothetical protein
MRRAILPVTCLSLMILSAISAVAQMPIPKPAPELSKLDYLAGNWISDGDIKPSPMGPGGKMSSDDQVHWMDGKFFLVMHSKFKGAMGDGMALAIMGYDPEKKVYTYNEYNSMGQINHSEGTITGDTWNWTSDENMGGQTFKGRYTMKVVSPTAYTFTYEMSQDGTNWTKVMEGKSMKK